MRFVSGAVITLFFIFLSLNSILAQNRADIFDSDVRIIESDESGITFTYMAPQAQLETPEGYPEKYQAPVMPRTAQIAKADAPLLPVKLVPIGIPYNSTPRVSVISQSFEPLAEVEVPNFISESTEKQFSAKTQSQILKKNWPLETAYIADETMVRGLKIIKLALAASKLENGTLYQAKNITVRVDFDAERIDRRYSPRPNGYIFDDLFSRTVANYREARNWRVDWPPIPFKTAMAVSSFDSSQVWVKIELVASGVYRLGRFELASAGVNFDGVDPRSFRVFYGGGRELPVDNDIARPELAEIPIKVTGESDGSFDADDLVLFYGESVDRSVYNDDDENWEYLANHYTARNVYWFTYGGNFGSNPKRWGSLNGDPVSQLQMASTFTDLAHEEQNLTFYYTTDDADPYDNYNWYAGNLEEFSYNIQLVDVVPGSQASIAVRSRPANVTLEVNNSIAILESVGGYFTRFTSSNLRGGTSFNTYNISRSGNSINLDYIDTYYSRYLRLYNGFLNFYGSDVIGTITYNLSGVPSDYLLLHISSPDDVAQIINGSLSSDSLVFNHSSDGRRQYYITSPSYYKSAVDLTVYEADDLRSTTNGADYIIVTHEDFYDQALELADHRENMSPGIRARVVKTEDIYNQFSWGLFDPTAIRDFLKYTYENWAGTAPSYAVLIGDGHYDYRNNWNNNVTNYIPPFHGISESTSRKSHGSDEAFVYFGDYGYLDSDSTGGLDMIIGRIPVRSTSQMDVVLDKIINYESNQEMGKWRNTVMVVADDNLSGPGKVGERMHTDQGERLATEHVPAEMEVKKIFLVDYPLRTGNSKPDAREALIAAFNEGGLIVDWIGHGNKGLWAHEALFRRVEDMPRLTNGYKLPLIFAASCSIGYYDHPTEQGLSEDFVRHEGGGGIVSIGATRKVFATSNAALNEAMFDVLLESDSVSFGSALYMAKFLRQVTDGLQDNDRKFVTLGDPAVVSGKPTLSAEFTYGPDSLRGLTVESIAGYITNDSGDVQTGYNGTVWVLVKDASINKTNYLLDYSGNPIGSTVNYVVPGPTIFYGPAEVTDGYFSSTFFIPKDITYGGSGAKIFVYFNDDDSDGHGVIDSLPMSGSLAADPDSSGPEITVTFNNQALDQNMHALPAEALLEIRLEDEHGINVTGTMGHGIEVKIDDGEAYSLDLTDDFVFDMGEWQQGAAAFRIPELADGEYDLTIKAWDNYNNSSVFSTYITVYADDRFSVSEVMNYPNPVVETDSTVFQYMLTNDAEAVSLKIFTLAGRKIKTFDLRTPDFLTSGYHYVPYNLRDTDGDRLASGVYIYKIEATGVGFDGARRTSDSVSKLAILR